MSANSNDADNRAFARHITDLFASMVNLEEAIEWILKSLSPAPSRSRGPAWQGATHLLVGKVTVQIVDAGWILARNLLLSLSLEARLNLHRSKPTLVAKVASVMKTYFILRYFAYQPVHASSVQGIEAVMDSFTQLALDPFPTSSNLFTLYYRYALKQDRLTPRRKAQKPVSVASSGDRFSNEITNLASLVLSNTWLPGNVSHFAKFLLKTRQYLHLQSLVRLMRLLLSEATPSSSKQTSGSTSLQHFLGRAHLHMGDYYKAENAFNQATQGIIQDDPVLLQFCQKEMGKHFFQSTQEHSACLIQYYTSVMGFFEACYQHDIAIRFALAAIALLQKRGSHGNSKDRLAKLWHKITIHAISMSNWEQAYGAVVSNPNQAHKDDGLRKLVLALCEKNAIATLCQLPFVGMLDSVNTTLKVQAESTPVDTKPHYYEILYAFHTYRANYAEAASTMYRFSIKLALESGQFDETLKRRISACLVALNALKTVDARYQFITYTEVPYLPCSSCRRPIEKDANYITARLPGQQVGKYYHDRCLSCYKCKARLDRREDLFFSHDQPACKDHSDGTDLAQKKRNSTGEIVQYDQQRLRQVILTVDDIEVHYLVLKAMQQLKGQFPDSHLVARPSLKQILAVFKLCIEAGLYELALALAQKLPEADLSDLFVDLTKRCLDQQVHPSLFRTRTDAWTTLLLNRHPSGNAWLLLKEFLALYDSERTNFRYHSTVAEAIWSADRRIVLPTFLQESFLANHPGAFISLLLKHNLIEDACRSVISLLQEVQRQLCPICRQFPLEARACTNPACKGTKSSRREQLLLPYAQIERLQNFLQKEGSPLLAGLEQAEAGYFKFVLAEKS